MRVVHLMASPFYGGPERQMLGLARHLPPGTQSVYLSFAERGLAQPFIDQVRRDGHEAGLLAHNVPHVAACVEEIAGQLRRLDADILCCSGYKPDVMGWRAARRVGIPVISVSHGWTAVTWRVRRYEALDRLVLRWMDAVVCVSEAQAKKVRGAGVPDARIAVIRNAVDESAFGEPDARSRAEMSSWFAQPPQWLIGAAGRLSPEKGFDVLIEAAAAVVQRAPGAGFVIFGDGPLRATLERTVAARGLQGRVVFPGFREDVRRLLPSLDLAVMSSFTEGLPVFLLEASAARLAAVATAVGGIPEVVDQGRTGLLVPPGRPGELAEALATLLEQPARRHAMGVAARARARASFSLAAAGQAYGALFTRLARASRAS